MSIHTLHKNINTIAMLTQVFVRCTCVNVCVPDMYNCMPSMKRDLHAVQCRSSNFGMVTLLVINHHNNNYGKLCLYIVCVIVFFINSIIQ